MNTRKTRGKFAHWRNIWYLKAYLMYSYSENNPICAYVRSDSCKHIDARFRAWTQNLRSCSTCNIDHTPTLFKTNRRHSFMQQYCLVSLIIFDWRLKRFPDIFWLGNSQEKGRGQCCIIPPCPPTPLLGLILIQSFLIPYFHIIITLYCNHALPNVGSMS